MASFVKMSLARVWGFEVYDGAARGKSDLEESVVDCIRLLYHDLQRIEGMAVQLVQGPCNLRVQLLQLCTGGLRHVPHDAVHL